MEEIENGSLKDQIEQGSYFVITESFNEEQRIESAIDAEICIFMDGSVVARMWPRCENGNHKWVKFMSMCEMCEQVKFNYIIPTYEELEKMNGYKKRFHHDILKYYDRKSGQIG